MLRLGASPASSSLSVMRRAAVSRSWYRPEGPSGGPLSRQCGGVPRSPTHQRGCKHTSAALQNRAPAARQAQRGSSDEEMETFIFGGRTKGDMNRGAAVPGARTRRSWLAPCGSARKSSWWAVLGAWWYKKGAAGFSASLTARNMRGLNSSVPPRFQDPFAKSAFPVDKI